MEEIKEKLYGWFILSAYKDFGSTSRILLGLCTIFWVSIFTDNILIQATLFFIIALIFDLYFRYGKDTFMAVHHKFAVEFYKEG